MNLPPRVRTQYPTARNIIETEITPVPIETVFFSGDGKQDPYQSNRYYFNYPGNWATSNNGENIIGLRSIKLQKSPIKLDFVIRIAKYTDEDYMNVYNSDHDHDYIINNLIENELAFFVDLNVFCWIKPDDFSYDNFFEAINDTLIYYIKKGWANGFVQNSTVINDKDILTEGYYDKNGYHIKIYSERNKTYVDEDSLSFKLIYANDNFKELFNVTVLDALWNEQIIFDKVWDLKPCYVFSSIAEQSAHHYIGTTDIEYHEIKYFKLNSSDQRFWVEFCSIGHDRTPACFPKSVSFAIEIQFQSFNKRLNG